MSVSAKRNASGQRGSVKRNMNVTTASEETNSSCRSVGGSSGGGLIGPMPKERNRYRGDSG